MLVYTRYIRMVTLLIAMLLLPTYLYFDMGQRGKVEAAEEPGILFSTASQMADLGEYKISNLAKSSDLIVIGEIIRVETANGDQQQGASKMVHPHLAQRLALTLTLEDVLKDTHLGGRASILNAVAIPRQSDAKSLLPVDSNLREATGKEKLKRHFPELTMSDPLVFFLRAPESPEAAEGRVLENEVYPGYQYVDAIKIEPGVVELVKRYIDIAQIEDLNQREQALVEMAFSLLRDRQTPIRFAQDALEDLFDLRRKSAEKFIGEDEIGELMQITTDPKRPEIVRSWALLMLRYLINDGRRIDPNPLLRMLEDSSDNVDLRLNVIKRLEQINTPEIRAVVVNILAREPATEEDKIVWRALANSKLVRPQ